MGNRKIILSVAVSLDGFIEGPNGEYDWCPPPSKKEMEYFLDRIDALFLGRKSYELVGGSSFRGKKHYVFSNSLESAKEKDVQLISGDFVSQVREIQKQGGKDIWLYGGASLTTSFMNEGLIDEMWLGLVPVVLGSGKLLFQNINQRNYFRFLEATQNKGYVSLRLGRKEK